MQVISKLVKIPKAETPSTEYIESELRKLNIHPLRWAVVSVGNKAYSVSVADLQN